MRIPIIDCESLKTSDLGPMNDDGERDLVYVWDTVAKTEDGKQWVHNLAQKSEKTGRFFAEKIKAHGSINPKYWTECTLKELYPEKDSCSPKAWCP
jgi:hypothetical protein